jgi:hypothetical protein
LITFSKIAENYLESLGYEVFECATEEEARLRAPDLIGKRKWPCYFFVSDTTGEKDFEEFFTSSEHLDLKTYENIGVIKNKPTFDNKNLEFFLKCYESIRVQSPINKQDIVKLFSQIIPNFSHLETGKYLDQKM